MSDQDKHQSVIGAINEALDDHSMELANLRSQLKRAMDEGRQLLRLNEERYAENEQLRKQLAAAKRIRTVVNQHAASPLQTEHYCMEHKEHYVSENRCPKCAAPGKIGRGA